MKRIILLAAILLLAACTPALTPAQEAAIKAQASRVITCTKGDDCDEKWSRALTWVTQHGWYKIRKSSQYMIETFGPDDADANSAIRVTLQAQGHGVYQIHFEAACANWIGCVPPVEQLHASFNAYVER